MPFHSAPCSEPEGAVSFAGYVNICEWFTCTETLSSFPPPIVHAALWAAGFLQTFLEG